MNLAQSLLAACERHPEREAFPGLRYGDLLPQIRKIAGGLGVAEGDRVAVVLDNRLETALLYWAAQWAGAVIVPLSWRLSEPELDYCVDDCGASLVLRDGDPLPDGPEHPGALTRDEAAMSLMLYTSGTTGRPKGVPRSHRADRAGGWSQALQHRYGPGDRTLGVMPLYHTMGIHSLVAMHLVGGCFVPQARWEPAEALRLIEEQRITSLYLAPTLFHDLVHCDTFGDHDVSSVRALGYAGAAMTSTLVMRCAEAFAPEVFVNHYGSTEVYTFSIGPDQVAKPGCAGRPAVNTRLRIEANGEICVHLSSDEAFSGYWQRPDADAKAIRDGWYHTGDTGHLDADGDLWIDGRLDDMIVSGGENIHPLEVEDILAAHPAVEEVAVIGAAGRPARQSRRRRRRRRGHCRGARRTLPRVAAGTVQAPARVPSGGVASEERIREDPAQGLARRAKGERVSEYDGFRIAKDAATGVATITLDVPGKFNRVSMLARDQLAGLFAELDGDDAVRFVVLTGAGGQFTAGGDIAGFLTKSPWVVSQLAKNVAAPERCSKPVIAKLQGYVFGVGLELALACDFRVAADDVQMALPEATIGMIPGSGGTQRLARLVGVGRAKDIIMRGRRVHAEEALALGLVTEVVASDALDETVAGLVAELSRHSPLSLAMAKRVIDTAYDAPLHVGLELEGLAYGLLQQTHDFHEGVEAFTEKRRPEFDGT